MTRTPTTTLQHSDGRVVVLTPKEEEQLAKMREPRDEAQRIYTERWLLLFEQAAQRQQIGKKLDAIGISS